jgi:hypothetical protein
VIGAVLFLGAALAAGAKPSPVPGSLPKFEAAITKLQARYPPGPTNSVALDLEGLSAELGIDLAPPLPSRRHPSRVTRQRIQRVAAGAFATCQVESAGETIDEPPDLLRQFLAANAQTLERIVERLSSGEPPRWELDVRRGGRAPEPNRMGQLALQRLLAAKALVDAREGRFEEASRVLEASWSLNQSLMGRPELASYIVAVGVARLQAGAWRKIVYAPETWLDRLRFEGLRAALIAAFRDASVFFLVGEKRSAHRPPEIAAFLNEMKRVGAALERQDPCGFSRQEARRVWKPLRADITAPNLISTSRRLFRLLIEAELTVKLMEVRNARRDGRWPEKLPDTESHVCPGSAWSYRVAGDGSMTVSFGGRLAEWPDEPGLKMPLAFTLGIGSLEVGARP